MFGRIKLYIVANKPISFDTSIADVRVYTIVTSLRQCTEYVNQYLKMKNLTHFRNWCDAHNVDSRIDSSWHKYCATVIQDQMKDFYVSSYVLNKHKIASLLRLSTGCLPVGCDFETEGERIGFIQNNFTPEQIEEIDNAITQELEKHGNK